MPDRRPVLQMAGAPVGLGCYVGRVGLPDDSDETTIDPFRRSRRE